MANAAIDAMEGDMVNAGISAAVPGIGDAAKAGTMIAKGAKAVAKGVAKEAVEKVAKEAAAGRDDIRVARMLMSLLTKENDIGMLQVVFRILGSIDIRIYYQSYLDALPRLVEDGAGWDIGMIAYPERDPAPAELIAISEIAKHAPRETQALFRKTLERSDCDADWAAELLDLIAPDESEKAY